MLSSHVDIGTAHGWPYLHGVHALVVGMIISYQEATSALHERAPLPLLVHESLAWACVSERWHLSDKSGAVWQLSVALHKKMKRIPLLNHTTDLAR